MKIFEDNDDFELRDVLLNILLPISQKGVGFITFKQLKGILNKSSLNMVLDNDVIKNTLITIPVVEKVESDSSFPKVGDIVYFKGNSETKNKQKNFQGTIEKMATKTAKRSIK
jgi:hypothetical protein